MVSSPLRLRIGWRVIKTLVRHRIHQWSVVRFVEMVNYPALTDGASPPRDLPLLGATSTPPQQRFHPTVPRTPRGVTEGLHRPEPQSRGPALTARGLHIYFLITVKTSLRGLSIPTEGTSAPLTPAKLKVRISYATGKHSFLT